jgi:hypothetical protein
MPHLDSESLDKICCYLSDKRQIGLGKDNVNMTSLMTIPKRKI